MSAETEYLDRLAAVMDMARGRREAEAAAVADAMAAMSAAVGECASFRAMDSAAFPFTVVDGGHEIPDGPPEFGASVCVLRDPRGVSRITAQARTDGADVTVECVLQPLPDGARQWRVQSDFRAFDGGTQTSHKDFPSAEKAATALRQRLLLVALPILSRGTIAGVPAIPDGDVAASVAVKGAIAAAVTAGEEARARRQRQMQESSMLGHSIRTAWDSAKRRLAFMAQAGFPVGQVKDGRGITTASTATGIEVTLHSGEERTVLAVAAHGLRPEMVEFSVYTSRRRQRQSRCFLPSADMAAVAAEMRAAVMEEVEALERSFLPDCPPPAAERSGAPAA